VLPAAMTIVRISSGNALFSRRQSKIPEKEPAADYTSLRIGSSSKAGEGCGTSFFCVAEAGVLASARETAEKSRKPIPRGLKAPWDDKNKRLGRWPEGQLYPKIKSFSLYSRLGRLTGCLDAELKPSSTQKTKRTH